MAGKKELMDKIETVTSERQEARAMLLGAEGKITKLKKENMELNEKHKELSKYIEFGVMLVDMPLGLGKEKTDELLKPIQERMNEQMKSIGIDMPIIIMQGNVKSFNTYMVDSVKKVE